MQPGESEIAVARLASTVIIARDAAAGGIEVLLTERHANMRFMAGAYVFPGGAVQDSDYEPGLSAQLHAGPPSWPHPLDPRHESGHAVAALRETFEEVGLLLGAPAHAAAQLPALRAKLAAGSDLSALLAEAGIRLDLHELVPFVQWITPRAQPIRFDTRFYVASAPPGQTAEHDAQECVASIWRSPPAALADAGAGRITLSPPTRRSLAEIEDVVSVAALLEQARSRPAPNVEPIIREIDGTRMILYPGDPEHPIRERALKGPTRQPF
jgi:8-oxo-dGTP pyrophosphatase MutT (NUDIX family)